MLGSCLGSGLCLALGVLCRCVCIGESCRQASDGFELFTRGFQTIDKIEEERAFEDIEVSLETGEDKHDAHSDDEGRRENCHLDMCGRSRERDRWL